MSSKKPLSIFFIDLEPDLANSAIFKITSHCFTKIKIKAPLSKKDIPQCLHCQSYGYTRTYRNHQPRCVCCGSLHDSSLETNLPNVPYVTAENYKGCAVPDDLAHGGAILLISSKISHSPFPSKSNQNIQLVATSVNINSIPTSIISAYFHPRYPFSS